MTSLLPAVSGLLQPPRNRNGTEFERIEESSLPSAADRSYRPWPFLLSTFLNEALARSEGGMARVETTTGLVGAPLRLTTPCSNNAVGVMILLAKVVRSHFETFQTLI